MAATGIQKQNSFDDIRILCCFIVIYEHCVVLTKIPYLNLDLRTPAVYVFFILSGYWVTRSYINSDSIRSYAKKRFNKIFPMLWGVVLTCAVFFSLFSTLGAKNYFTSTALYKYIICNGMTLNFLCQNLPGVFAGTYGDGVINGALWTLKIELGFYIILPILYLIYKSSKNKKSTIIGLFLISLFMKIAISVMVSRLSLSESLDNQLPSFLPYFLFGMILSVEGGGTALCSDVKTSLLCVSCSLFHRTFSSHSVIGIFGINHGWSHRFLFGKQHFIVYWQERKHFLWHVLDSLSDYSDAGMAWNV